MNNLQNKIAVVRGGTMTASGGKANPKVVNEILRKRLS